MENRPQRILVRRTSLSVCEKGDVVSERDTGEDAWMFIHACGEYTWEDQNFCINCGKSLRTEKN